MTSWLRVAGGASAQASLNDTDAEVLWPVNGHHSKKAVDVLCFAMQSVFVHVALGKINDYDFLMQSIYEEVSSLSALKLFVPLSVSVTLLCGLIYATMQQTFRRMADMVPVQWAEDAAATLARGQMPDSSKSAAKVDLAESLSPYSHFS